MTLPKLTNEADEPEEAAQQTSTLRRARLNRAVSVRNTLVTAIFQRDRDKLRPIFAEEKSLVADKQTLPETGVGRLLLVPTTWPAFLKPGVEALVGKWRAKALQTKLKQVWAIHTNLCEEYARPRLSKIWTSSPLR